MKKHYKSIKYILLAIIIASTTCISYLCTDSTKVYATNSINLTLTHGCVGGPGNAGGGTCWRDYPEPCNCGSCWCHWGNYFDDEDADDCGCGRSADSKTCHTCGHSHNEHADSSTREGGKDCGHIDHDYRKECRMNSGNELKTYRVSGGWEGEHYYLTFTDISGNRGSNFRFHSNFLGDASEWAGPSSSMTVSNSASNKIEVYANGSYRVTITCNDHYNGQARSVAGTITVDDYGTVITFDKNIGDKNIYDDTYTTSVDGNLLKKVYIPNTPINLPDCPYTREGYYFVCWSTNPNIKVNRFTNKSDYELQAADIKVLANTVDYNVTDLLKGVTGEETNSTGAWRDKHVVTLYAIWAPNYYRTYYERGLTDDITHTDISNATRNNNIQSTGTNRPYTHDIFDRNMSLGGIGTVLGRSYFLRFNSNIPGSVVKQLHGSEAVPTETSTITGYLPSNSHWEISEANRGNGEKPAMITNLTQPNYESGWYEYAVATALWNNKELNNYSKPTLNGWKFVGWYDNQQGRNSTPVSNTTDMIRVVNDSTNVSPNTSVNVVGNVTSHTVQPRTVKFDQTLYARWQRTIHLAFNMNGGEYQGNPSDVVLTGIYYNNADGYNFTITNKETEADLPNYEKQQNIIDAYGIYTDKGDFNSDALDKYNINGENSKYTKYDNVNDVTYRFIGWSLNPNATEPDADFIGFKTNHKTTYRVYDDTTLYAVWEPVLMTNITLKRTLGDLSFSDGTFPISTATKIRASSGTQYIGVIAKPGEQCYYQITAKGRDNIIAGVAFDNKIIDIYTHSGKWDDNLNPWTTSGEELNSACGLDRRITINKNASSIIRKFYIPQYLGTENSYESSKGVTTYQVLFEIAQDSFFYRTVYNKSEQVEVLGTIYITNQTSSGGIDPVPPNPFPPAVISVLDELRAKLKIKLH